MGPLLRGALLQLLLCLLGTQWTQPLGATWPGVTVSSLRPGQGGQVGDSGNSTTLALIHNSGSALKFSTEFYGSKYVRPLGYLKLIFDNDQVNGKF